MYFFTKITWKNKKCYNHISTKEEEVPGRNEMSTNLWKLEGTWYNRLQKTET